VKDNIDVAGLPTTAACPDFAFVPQTTAPAAARLLAAGAVLIGKTNLDQSATGLVGVRTPHPIPRNAFDPVRVPGGSSSGSTVAQGLATLALGTNTAGSGRVPAALNNLVGLKPSLGVVSTRGVVPACRTLDCVSVFALSVADAWAAFAALAGEDAEDPFSRPIAWQSPAEAAPIHRLGLPRLPELDEAEGRAAWGAARTRLAALDLGLAELDLADCHAVAQLLYDGP
jgi:allophanate hydrolase